MKRKVSSRKYPHLASNTALARDKELFLLRSFVFLVKNEGFPERKLLER